MDLGGIVMATISGGALVVLIFATIIDVALVAVAFCDFLKKEKK